MQKFTAGRYKQQQEYRSFTPSFLGNSGCFIFANEMRVSIPSVKSYFYPDVGIVCEEPVLKTMFLIYSSTRLPL